MLLLNKFHYASSIYDYNPLTRKIKYFNIRKDRFFEITGFFFDRDKDSNPEICILNIGKAPRDYVTPYTIFSTRQDSVAVCYN